jgi:hypothetical protein
MQTLAFFIIIIVLLFAFREMCNNEKQHYKHPANVEPDFEESDELPAAPVKSKQPVVPIDPDYQDYFPGEGEFNCGPVATEEMLLPEEFRYDPMAASYQPEHVTDLGVMLGDCDEDIFKPF